MLKDSDGAKETHFDSEQELRLLVETVPALVWRAGPDGNVEYVNKRVLQYFGAPLSDIVGWGWADRVHPEDVAFKVRSWLKNLETESPHDVVCRFRGADSRYRWFNIRGEPLKSSNGSVLCWYGVLIDIDDKIIAEEAIREREYRLRQIFETVPGLLWSTDPSGEPTQLNQRMLDYTGMRFEDFKNGGWGLFLHHDDFPETARAFQHAIQTGTSYQVVHRLRRADGECRWHHTRGEPLRDRQGRIVQWYGLSVDIDDAKKAEGRLRRSEAYLTEAQRLSHSGVAAYDRTSVLYGSEEIYRIWGFDPAQGVPSLEAIFQRVHPDDGDRMRAQVELAVIQKRDYSIAYRIALPDGTIKHLEAIGRPAFSPSGELIEIVTTQIDVTERKRAEDQLRRSEALLAEAQRLTHSGVSVYREATILYWSEETYRIWGFDPALGIPSRDAVFQRIHPEDRNRVRADSQRLFNEKRGYSIGFRIVLPDRSVKYLESINEPVFSASREIVEAVATHVDVTQRKRAEEALRESEHKLRQIFETVPGLLWSTDPTGEPSQLNQRMLDYTGMRFEDFENGGWEAFVHPDDFPATAGAFHHAIHAGASYQAVHRFRRADGEFRWHHTRGEPLRDREGQIVQWYGLSVDIDEAKKAEDRLRRSEAHLAEAQRLSHSGASAYTDTAILYWSEETYRIWGFDPALGIPRLEAVTQRIHPDDRDRAHAHPVRAWKEKIGYAHSYRIVLPNGTVKHLESIGEPVLSASGELIEVVATQIDVTERKRAEQALRESEAKFRDYAESASDWFWEIGPEYRFTSLTENAFGSDAADRIGTKCWDGALDLEGEPEKWQLLWATLDSRKQFRDFVYRSARGKGSPIFVKASGKPVFEADREFRGYRGTGTDVTALMLAQMEHERLRQLESDLAHMNRLNVMGELTASLAHEITQPIAAARNNARAAMNFLDKHPPETDEVREALHSIVDDADRAGDIIDRIRDHIKKAPPRKSHFDLNKAIDEVIGLARSEITANGVSVRTGLAVSLTPVEGDRVQLQQVVLNLILNAVEAMSTVEGEHRELLISTEQTQTGGVLVSVSDSGPGIDPTHLDRVFQAFYTTKSSGVGMGLSISRSIIDAHGGRLWASMNSSLGAVLQFSLPGAAKGVTNSRRAAHGTGEPPEDTVSDAAHQRAYEGTERPRRP